MEELLMSSQMLLQPSVSHDIHDPWEIGYITYVVTRRFFEDIIVYTHPLPSLVDVHQSLKRILCFPPHPFLSLSYSLSLSLSVSHSLFFFLANMTHCQEASS